MGSSAIDSDSVFLRKMKVTYLIVGLSLVTLGQAIRCYQCSGTNGLCSSEADNGSGSSCYNSGEICWFEHDTSDGQDRYYRKCGKGLETGCFVENTENGGLHTICVCNSDYCNKDDDCNFCNGVTPAPNTTTPLPPTNCPHDWLYLGHHGCMQFVQDVEIMNSH